MFLSCIDKVHQQTALQLYFTHDVSVSNRQYPAHPHKLLMQLPETLHH